MEHFAAIPVFVAVVEAGSFSAAAAKLGLTKSAVSKRVQQLEAGLNVRLLQRTTRRQSLTEAGERYYDSVRHALAIAMEAEEAAAGLQSQAAGVLRVSAPMAFGRLHLSPLVPAFLRRHPAIELDLAMDDRMVDLVADGYDLAVRIGNLPDNSMVARRLAPCRVWVCASPDYLAEYGEPRHPAELAQHNCIAYSYYRGGASWVFQGPQGEIRVQPRGNYLVNNSEARRDALLAGLGICEMPTFLVGPDLAAGRLKAVLTDYPLPRHAIHVVYPERRRLPAKARVFIDFLQEKLGGDLPLWDSGLPASLLASPNGRQA
ncbi:LysR family transcriptional regulator [Chromobacterium alticapitis]|uniref:LysR family transcriptional regulator n=1 Tax=Chromobacterium alticapitis TaxID=2073169 RepID=A0A2S5DKQ9_9NEIS|nr:LysR family transcriptional regulator [Chromobacterium alticapitis]POZ63680.1 LysR family transcriptional regulator [Chromobacterium alticapitis]